MKFKIPEISEISEFQRWKNVLDKKGYGGAVLMYLSKAFDTLNHDLFIANYMLMVFQKSLSN